MSGFDFDKSGTFGSEKTADDYAKRNDLSVQDYQRRREAKGVELEVRRSAVEGEKLHDTGEGRKRAFSKRATTFGTYASGLKRRTYKRAFPLSPRPYNDSEALDGVQC